MSELKMTVPARESIKVLLECIEIQAAKSRDYQNPLSSVKQADHYPHGIQTIMDMAHQKLVRYKSLIEAFEFGEEPKFEAIEDSLKDAINYLSFAVSYLRGRMDGQSDNRDIFNKIPRAQQAAKSPADETIILTEESDK